MTAVLSHSGRTVISHAASVQQRLQDALRIRRGSVPAQRDYGSLLHTLLDRPLDADLSARVANAVADAIAHPANGLSDIDLQSVQLAQSDNQLSVTVHARNEQQTIAVTV